jgi:hypothetical protein
MKKQKQTKSFGTQLRNLGVKLRDFSLTTQSGKRQKVILISVLSLAFLVAAGSAVASMTFNSNTITSDGILNLTPTGQPVTINGNVTIAGAHTLQMGENANITVGTNISGSLESGQIGASGTYTSSTSNQGGIVAYTFFDGGPSATYLSPWGTYGAVQVNSGQIHNWLSGLVGYAENDSADAVAPWISAIRALPGYDDTGNTTNQAGVYIENQHQLGTHALNLYGLYIEEQTGGLNTEYYSWFDSRGVGRCKEDNTFNSVGQSICAVYNPQFTKYTPGASNYERTIYGEWNGNVAQIGTEAGGTGTLRDLRLIGANIDLNASVKIAGDMVYVTTAPTITSGFGGAGKAIAGKASSFKITVGAGGGSTGVAAFNGTFTNAPSCFANDETTANAMQAVATTTQVTINGTMVASDVIKVVCLGY